jgi:putative CocE/NonD family hydrolase
MDVHGALVALIVAALALAGCLGDETETTARSARDLAPLSEPTLSVGAHEEEHFVGTLGTQLYIDWLLPDAPGPFPTIMAFTPYQGPDPVALPGGEGSGDPGAPYSQYLVDTFVPRGYAVAFADVRGNHEAGGCIDQTGPEQWQDGYDYVEWIAAQPWSDGAVGMWGHSYVGETQFTTAMMQPPHLRTIVPSGSVSNQYDWNFYAGVPYVLQPTLGMVAYLQGSLVPSTDPANLLAYPEKFECQGEALAAGLDLSGDNTPFWQERDYRPLAAQIDVPVLHLHGLADWNVRPVHIDPIFNDLVSEKRAVYGQWGHSFPDRDDYEDLLIAWYDHHLKGLDNGIMERLPPVLIEDDQQQWWGIASFPPLDGPWLALDLSADAALVAPGTATAGSFVMRDVPSDVALGAAELPTGLLSPVPTSATWTWTAPDELRLVGRPRVEFTAASSAASTHWVVRLEVDGAACAGLAVCQNHGYLDSRHRDGTAAPSDVGPGEPYRANVTMYPQYDVIPAGTTLRLVITNNDADIQQDATASENTIFVGGTGAPGTTDAAARLWLPLAPAQVALPEDTLPWPFPGVV